ncbi:MAG: WG repeat-containing protein [Bacteroidetes bacterium]|nr:WG repeat-containing protein [Bacteroidota bacterium]
MQSPEDIAYGNSLIRIFSEGKVGYIDTTGKVAIKPVFANAYDFYDGPAAARISGKYGFINTKGVYVVQPKYDYAESFRNGTALIYKDSTAGFLFADGKEIFFPNYSSVKFITDSAAIVKTYYKHSGIINSKGEFIIDTVFSEIGEFENGVASVYKIIPSGNIKNGPEYEVSVINSEFNFIVTPEKYKYASVSNGRVRVTLYGDSAGTEKKGYVSKTGELKIFDFDFKNYSNDYTFTLLNDTAAVIINRNYKDDSSAIILNGNKKIYIDKQIFYIQPLTENTFLVNYTGWKKSVLMNDMGERIIDTNAYDLIKTENNDKNYIILQKNSLYALYDTKGNELIPYQEKEIYSLEEYGNWNLKRRILFFKESGNFYYKTPVVSIFIGNDLQKKDTVTNVFRFIINKNGTLSAFDSSYYYCFNKSRRLIYKSKLFPEESVINIDYIKEMNYEPSRVKGKRTIDFNKSKIKQKGITLFVNDKDAVLLSNRFKAFEMYIINTYDTVVKVGITEFINIRLQALNEKEEWKYIEGQFNFFIDFDYVPIMLSKNNAQQYIFPIFEGDFETKIRAELEIADPYNYKKTLKLHSNEIECKINRTQFWRRLDNFNYDFANPYTHLINP